jgi:hypothetical protein
VLPVPTPPLRALFIQRQTIRKGVAHERRGRLGFVQSAQLEVGGVVWNEPQKSSRDFGGHGRSFSFSLPREQKLPVLDPPAVLQLKV